MTDAPNVRNVNPDKAGKAPAAAPLRRKRINHRQWWHRLTHRKCWNCNVRLEYVIDRDGRRCPMCLTFYSETAMVAHERRVLSRWWLRPWRAEA